ncbi:MAG TPA: ATP-binding cassette domain-containing protein [Candidatus Acidoferrales bacterium]|jgi:molybdate transport system permease protein|nr:ATP-binding cassette domain-containing protein [Candidatus Acidoferrales bacterium]
MALEVQIEKKLPEFTLDVTFTAGNAPMSILGPSGAGKTMLLRCIAGLERPHRGRIALDGRVLLDTEKCVHVSARDRRVGMLFQHFALFPHRTVAENIAFGLQNLTAEEQARCVADLLRRTHISGFEKRYPRQLSGGEQQRAALARALAIEPETLLLDEPLSALDTHLRSQMETQLQETFAAYRRPALVVTHNIEEAYRLSEQMLVLSRGRIAAFGAREEIFQRPPNLEVARLTGCKNFSRARTIAENVVEALDWGCQLRVANATIGPVAHVGIRAHHLDFVEAGAEGAPQENIFPCWLVRSSETPFRTTLYLSLHRTRREAGDIVDLQAEVSKGKWKLVADHPFPWHLRIAPESLFVMPD